MGVACALLPALAQDAALAPAPRVDWEALKETKGPWQASVAAAAGWLDTSNRTAVAQAWASQVSATENVSMGWTGAVSGCVAGDVSATWRAAVLSRINWFRGMAGVPAGIVFEPQWNGQNQQAALMMSANQTLSHTPPSNWACYTASGAEAAGKSNICYLTGFGNVDPGCVSGYMQDYGDSNQAVGHRRWLLYPQSTRMGTGDVSQSGNNGRANAIWVVDSATYSTARPATRDGYVAWPPKGYVPYQTVYARWSFSYPGASFANSTIAVTRNGSPLTVNVLPVESGYGENTLVWEPSVLLGVAGADTTVDVSINNVLINGQYQSFRYQVVVFDPATVPGAGSSIQVTINSSPTGRVVTVDGGNYQAPHTFQWTPGSSHTLSVPTPQTVSDFERAIFRSWNFSSTNSQTVAPSANTSYTINFDSEYKLTTNVVPTGAGSIAVTPPSATGFYAAGSRAVLVASPQSPYVFSNWSGDASGTNPQIDVLLDRPITATALYSSPSGTPTSGLHFVPVTPCRIADTRNAQGAFGGPVLRGGITRSFLIPQSTCAIPSTAKAYSLNLTVVPSTPLGYMSVWPTGAAQPFVSTLNATDGQVTANAAVVPAGLGGGINVYPTNDTHLVIDINGYFDVPQPAASAFYPLTPCRILDTRNPNGVLGGPALPSGVARSMPVRQSACGIPANATAYVLNVTVVPQAPLGYISTWPTGQAQPFVSTTNAPTGQITANMAIVPAGIDGAVSFFASNTTHVVVDINGYFGPPTQPGALSLYPVTPCRLVDTRNPSGVLGGPVLESGVPRSFPLASGSCSLPLTARAYSANFTVVPDMPLGYLTTWPTGSAQPFVSTLNANDGQITANAAIVPSGSGGAISVFVTNRANLVIDTNGYFAP